jgi:ABC-type branched-subunit amino acid transport system ATPase component
MVILQIQNLTKNFNGIKAVDNLSFEIERGSIVALVGPNGSGKTTIFNIINGFLKPDAGKIFFNEKEITPLTPYKIAQHGVGRTFQNIRLFPQMTVLDNVMLAIKYGKEEGFFSALFQTKMMKEKENKSREKAKELLDFVGLTEKKDVLGEELSHGQRKLLELARILALEPDIFLLDEPLAGLFPEKRKKMLDLLKQLNEKGKTILLIEHDINSVMDFAQKIIVLDYGKRIAEGRPEEIRENKEVLRVYLGKIIP